MGSDDQSSLIIKGKRTKRQRSSSPFGVAATADSSSSGCLGGERSERERGVVVDDFCNSVSSPTTSGEIYESTEEEEEDMANCLIMLAQGDAPRQIQQEDGKINEKFNTSYRKFSSIITNTSNKVGFYMYECKTCNRSFPSFQALGGHRASHKKPKAIMEEKKSSVIVEEVKGVSVKESGQLNKSSSSPPVVPLQVAANSKANKIHECSICGSEFTSGQALGGHMRRHRAAAAAATVNNQVGGGGNSEAISNESNSSDHKPQPPNRSILQLDLNLPAPPEDHDHHHLRDSKFQFGSTQQALVFSTPAFVDCHY